MTQNLGNFVGLTGEKKSVLNWYDEKVNLEFLAEIIKLQGEEWTRTEPMEKLACCEEMS